MFIILGRNQSRDMDWCIPECCDVYGYFCNFNQGKLFYRIKGKYVSLELKWSLQLSVLFNSKMLFFLKGTMVAGGISKVVEINKDSGRLDMFEYV